MEYELKLVGLGAICSQSSLFIASDVKISLPVILANVRILLAIVAQCWLKFVE